MKNKQSGLIVPLVIALIAVIAVGFAFYVHLNNSQPAAVVASTAAAPRNVTPPGYVITQLNNLNNQVIHKSPTLSTVIVRTQLQQLTLQYTRLSSYIIQNYPALSPYLVTTASATVSAPSKK
jgi:flagellar basal body-associated protein FliL